MDNLSVKARQVRNAGRYEDTQLIHLSDEELAMLKQQWGVPGKNPDTGLPEYGILGSILKFISPAYAAVKASKSDPKPGYVPVAKDPTFSAKLPEAKGIFANLAAKPSGMTADDYMTYGQIKRTPEGGAKMGKTGAEFFDYAVSPERQQADIAAANANPYFDQYSDVADEWERLNADPAGKASLVAMGITTPQQFSNWHFTEYGSKENRVAPVGYKAPVVAAEPVPVAPSDLAVQAYKKGGSVRKEFAVHGEGTGRSDSIPAVLSDGEYVIDAETVALLGDGSSKAGAKALDDFRVNIRKHKGAKLAQGKFSVKAKAPHHYMTGGKV